MTTSPTSRPPWPVPPLVVPQVPHTSHPPHSAHPADLPHLADPGRVHSTDELCRELNLLRDRGPGGRPRRRPSFSQLARTTGIPRSTLHSYFTGTLPDVATLDLVVLALGCPPGAARAWAEAWQRVVEAGRQNRLTARGATGSRLQRIEDDVRRLLDRPTDHWYDASVQVAVNETAWIGADRRLRAVDVDTTLRARTDGVDRWALKVLPPCSARAETRWLGVSHLGNAREGVHRWFAESQVRVLEVLLDQPLRRGETVRLGFRVEYAVARAAAAAAGHAPAYRPCTQLLRGLCEQGPSYTQQVRFEGAVPESLRQVYLEEPDGAETVVHELRPGTRNQVCIGLEQPAVGLHGIRWAWPAGDPQR